MDTNLKPSEPKRTRQAGREYSEGYMQGFFDCLALKNKLAEEQDFAAQPIQSMEVN